MPDFVQRTTAPATSERFYYADNPFYKAGYGMPNCTCYAFGRFWELSGTYPSLSLGDAEKWYNYNDGYKRGQTPKLGAVIVWSVGDPTTGNDGSGHVAIVEQINADGSIVTSNSAWGGTLFYRQTVAKGYQKSGYKFLGFIYNPVNFEDNDEPVISGNRYLTREEMKINARYIYNVLSAQGYTLNAIAAMLGNMEAESTINPALWESRKEGNTSGGLGLVQWTPATRLITWANDRSLDYLNIDTQLSMLIWEVNNGDDYYATSAYPETYPQFIKSTKTPEYLAKAFLLNYERPDDQSTTAQEYRAGLARYWYDYLINYDPVNPSPSVKNKQMSLLLMLAATGRL